jgi:AcrR family transcriptional regulator
MSASPPSGRPGPGLRERKKLKTRLAIQEHALRLIKDQGYENTTVEQIAEAAEISPSTFFRYFPTKDAVVLTDEYDPLLIEAFRAQPPEVPVVHAFRIAYREVFSDLTGEEAQTFFERAELVLQVPELRASFLDSLVDSVNLLVVEIAERSGRPADDPGVRAVSGAVVGVAITEFLYWSAHPAGDFAAAIDAAMELLEPAFPW